MSDAEMVTPTVVGIGAGFLDHNLTCWMCGENSAFYCGHPVWAFLPCADCRRNTVLTFDMLAEAAYRAKRDYQKQRWTRWRCLFGMLCGIRLLEGVARCERCGWWERYGHYAGDQS